MKYFFIVCVVLSLSLNNVFAQNEVTLYQGNAVNNGAQHNGGATNSYGVEIERKWTDTFNYSLGYFNYGTMGVSPEGKGNLVTERDYRGKSAEMQTSPGESIKRDLFTMQVVYPIQLSKNLGISFQGGPALADTTRVMSTGGVGVYTDSTHLVLVHGITVYYSVTKNIALVGMMQRTDLTQHTSDGLYVGLRFSPLSF